MQYTDPIPVEELAEKYRKGQYYCWRCELEEKRRRWSLYDDKEKAAYLAGMQFVDGWARVEGK
eukprot:11066079-Prorocentrum_lima.AAC.1